MEDTEVKFIDFQNDKRFKRLHRALKLNLLRNNNVQESNELCSLSMVPSNISTINEDALDSSTNFPQDPKNGNEIVSSCNNLRNMVLKKSNKNTHKTFATSSVKQYNAETDSPEDTFLMPPPNINHVPCICKKADHVLSSNIIGNQRKLQINNDKESRKTNTVDISQINSNIIKNRKVKVFKKWKIILYKQDQLVIKGTIERGRLARSKSITKRISTTVVESICKHLYRLEGNIVDDEHELPDYVRNKFFNGFPDDWVNVCEIWQTFLQQGCRITFRWPTTITDSDDDLRSEITDITYVSPKSPKDDVPKSKSSKESYASFPSISNALQTQTGKENCNPSRRNETNLFTQTCMSDTNPITTLNNGEENCNQKENVTLNCFYSKNDTNKLMDKLIVIINSLAVNNCHKVCLNTIGELLDWLHCLILDESVKNNKSNIMDSRLEQNKCVVQKQSNTGCNDSKESFPLQNIITGNKFTKCSNSIPKAGTTTNTENSKDNNNSDDESEIYAGVRKISVTQILHKKRIIIEPPKRKLRKNVMHRKSNTVEKNTLNVPSKKISNANYDDSSVSIIEDKERHTNYRNYISPNNRSNLNKYTKSDMIEKKQSNSINAITTDKNTCTVHEHIVQKTSRPFHKCIKNLNKSFHAIDDNKCMVNVNTESKSHTAEANAHTETVQRKNHTAEANSHTKTVQKKNHTAEANSHMKTVEKKNEVTNNRSESLELYKQVKEDSTKSKNIPTLLKPVVVSLTPIVYTVNSLKPSANFIGEERVYLQKNNSVYCPDTSRNSSTIISHKTPSENNQGKKLIEENNEKKNSLDKSKSDITIHSETLHENNSSQDLKDLKDNKHQKLIRKKKKRIVQSFESSDSNDSISVPVNKRQKVITTKQQELPKSANKKKQNDRLANKENSCESYLDIKKTKLTPKSVKLSPMRTREMSKKLQDQYPVDSYSNIICTYRDDVSLNDDISPDEDSHV